MPHNLHIIDLVIIASYLLICLAIGFLSIRKVTNMRDYALGGKYTHTFVLIGTFFATDVGAGLTVVSVERVYSMGLIFVVAMMFRSLLWLIVARVFGNRIDYFKEKGCLSISDIMETLYGATARKITNILAFAFSIGILTIQITAMSYLFGYFLDFSPTEAALIAFAVLVTYSFFGGMRAVAITDVLQASIFFIGIPLACYLAYIDIGLSFDVLYQQLPKSHTHFSLDSGNTLFFVSLVVCSIIGPITDGPLIQRYLMSYNSKQLREALQSCFYMSIFFSLTIVFIGYLIKVKAPDIDPNTALFYLVDNYLPVGIKGLLIAGLLATIMSTADSWLNTASVLFAHDIMKKITPKMSTRQELLSARIFLLFVSALAAFMAILNNNTLKEINWMVGNCWTPIVFTPIVAGFLMLNTNTKSFIASATLAFVGVFIGYLYTHEIATTSELLGVLGSTIGLFGMHYYQSRNGVFGDNKNVSVFSMNTLPKMHFQPLSFKSLLQASQHLVVRHGRFYYLVGTLGFICFLGSLFLNGLYHTPVVITLNIIAAFLSLLLCMHEYIFTPNQQEKYMPLFFHTSLFAIFALNAGYKLFLSNFETLWLLNFVLSLLVIYFVAGFRVFSILSVISILASLMLLRIFKESYDASFMPSIGYFIIFISAIIFAAKNREFFESKEIGQRDYYAQMMAHQMMQPITQTSFVANHLHDMFSKYKTPEVDNAGKSYYLVEESDFKEVNTVIKDFKRASRANELTIRGLLTMTKDDIELAKDINVYDLNECVLEAVSLYSDLKRARINVQSDNTFSFRGSKILMIEVIRNLIDNSFKYAGTGSNLEIWFEKNQLHIKDNGAGIEPEKLLHLFDATHTHGLGLPFCKRVMEAYGTTIDCYSIKGSFTEFVLKF